MDTDVIRNNAVYWNGNGSKGARLTDDNGVSSFKHWSKQIVIGNNVIIDRRSKIKTDSHKQKQIDLNHCE